jgi:short-subunit dehydrogenase
MTAIRGAAAAVTGAASGIGRALALELAARGCDLALADRDEAGLQAVAAEIAKAGSQKVTVHRVDVAEPGQIADFALAAIAAHPKLNIVVNNAGVALLGNFVEVEQAQMDWLMNINFWGVVHATRAFLPHLSQKPEAHIVNLSSIFGIVAPPGQTAYAAAKFAVRGFSESLRHELQMANSPVKLSVVHPGGVSTNIVRNSRAGTGVTDNARRARSIERFDAMAKTTPAAAALRIIAGIEKNAPRILIGNEPASWTFCSGCGPAAIGRCWPKGSRRRRMRRGSSGIRQRRSSFRGAPPRPRKQSGSSTPWPFRLDH